MKLTASVITKDMESKVDWPKEYLTLYKSVPICYRITSIKYLHNYIITEDMEMKVDWLKEY